MDRSRSPSSPGARRSLRPGRGLNRIDCSADGLEEFAAAMVPPTLMSGSRIPGLILVTLSDWWLLHTPIFPGTGSGGIMSLSIVLYSHHTVIFNER